MKTSQSIYYFDNNATTKVAPEVVDAMIPFLKEHWGNPSSAYSFGHRVTRYLEEYSGSTERLRTYQQYRVVEVPFVAGEALMIRHALAVAARNGLVPFCDERVHWDALRSRLTSLQRNSAVRAVLSEYGYLKASIEELSGSTGLEGDRILAVLKVIQTFDPAGVGARDLRECLLLQLERSGQKNTLEYRIVDEFMDALGKRRIPEIARGTGQSVDDVQSALERIARLEPRPGRAFLPDNDQYILPEVFVQKVGDDFSVTTNNEHIPHLRISNTYKDLMSHRENSAEVRNYIREKIRAGKFLIKSLHQRQQTILNIAKEIVRRQREFMDKGVAFLKPLTMVQVAEVVGVHETTVSRAVSGKYMQTPQGLFEMKYFFTAGIQTASVDGLSNTSVKDMIADIFKKEDATKPLSDQEVVKMLQERGIVIARRTVAKYRTELNILPSNLRKVY